MTRSTAGHKQHERQMKNQRKSQLVVSDEELELHIAHGLYEMFNTTLKVPVISWHQSADSV